jgi:hypothetical protein
MNFGEPSLLHQPRSSMRLRVKRLQDWQLNRSTSRAVSASWSGCAVRDSRAVKQSDLAGAGTGGEVGPAVSAHLTDEPRPDLTQDGSPVQAIIPEFGKHVLA